MSGGAGNRQERRLYLQAVRRARRRLVRRTRRVMPAIMLLDAMAAALRK